MILVVTTGLSKARGFEERVYIIFSKTIALLSIGLNIYS